MTLQKLVATGAAGFIKSLWKTGLSANMLVLASILKAVIKMCINIREIFFFNFAYPSNNCRDSMYMIFYVLREP